MRYVTLTFVALLAIVAVVIVVGYLLPVAHTASREAVIGASPADVYETISDVEDYAQWWPEISRVDLLQSQTGRVRFRQHTASGPIIFAVDEAVPPSRFVTRIADPDQPFGGTWTIELTPEGAGTRVTITERGEVYNPVFRFLSRFVFGYTGTMERCLRALERQLGPS
jgi:uncharacterized protein YndB with AHSA1/START domain